ncbi:MAG TPA: hypothetical protein VHQ65_13615 [Thermoanaerobaculia bacterium]|nr:hypothetical protein [Thermoanaerobaculia bacterium]
MSTLAERITAFVRSGEGDFEALALEAFAFQYERIAPLRRLCQARDVAPGSVSSWREIPPVPAAAFRSLGVGVAEAGAAGTETFRSSGTTQGEAARSTHVQAYPDLYRATLDAALPRFCPLVGTRPSMLALVPSREQAPDSSLAFMIDHVLHTWGGPGSTWAFGSRGVDARAARSWLGARQRERRPAMVFATAFALADWLDSLDKMDLRFRLPAGSAVFETGGYKGRRSAVEPEHQAARLQARLGIAPDAVLREYGMTELTSQLYTRGLVGGDPRLYVAPPWVRVRVLDPESLAERPAGEPGLVAILDLANLGSAVHLLTEDLGAMEPGGPGEPHGLRLLGRAAGAELRGCSLTVEELASAGVS